MFAYMGGPPGPVKPEDDSFLERLHTTNYSDEGGKNIEDTELNLDEEENQKEIV